MLDVKRALTTGMLTYGGGNFTILESSEDLASEVLEKAIYAAERRGARAQRVRDGWPRRGI